MYLLSPDGLINYSSEVKRKLQEKEHTISFTNYPPLSGFLVKGDNEKCMSSESTLHFCESLSSLRSSYDNMAASSNPSR